MATSRGEGVDNVVGEWITSYPPDCFGVSFVVVPVRKKEVRSMSDTITMNRERADVCSFPIFRLVLAFFSCMK